MKVSSALKKLGVTLGIAVLTAMPLASSVYAQTPTLGPVAQAKCNLVTSRVELLTTRYNNNKDRHIAVYQKAKDRVTELVAKLETKGYDVAKLKTDLQTWDGQIKNIGTQYSEFIAELNKSKQYACGQSQGDFKAALQAARVQLADVRQASLDARNFYQSTIRADLTAIKNQKK